MDGQMRSMHHQNSHYCSQNKIKRGKKKKIRSKFRESKAT